MIHQRFSIIGLPERPVRPRDEGITIMLDKGLSCRQVEDFLDISGEYVDIVKLGWGTAVITPALERKLDIYRSAGVSVYFGGTLFEAFYLRGQLDTYRRILTHFGIEHLEVSDGSIEMDHPTKLACIRSLAQDFTVLSEVGSKDAEKIMPPYKWVQMIQAELEAGSWKVILESRESGTVGLFRGNGEVRSGLVDEIVDLIDRRRLVFEAPQKAQQVWFIKHSGPNVNLGNIGPDEVLPLETLRLGLRADTLFDFFPPSDVEPVLHDSLPAAEADGRGDGAP
ncbi:MAG TPA: phosphosulfolactate synthase [Rhodothermales bacterium]|nr:phosphosulfolactate synthase [Rhodothermales bacterium]